MKMIEENEGKTIEKLNFFIVHTGASCLKIIDLSAPHDTICKLCCMLRNRTAVIDEEWSSNV
jgi:hypothetical protein